MSQRDRPTKGLEEELIWRGDFNPAEVYYVNHLVRAPSGALWRARAKTSGYPPPSTATTDDIVWDLHSGPVVEQQVVEGSGAFAPVHVPAGTTFHIPAGQQVLYSIPIDVDGVIDCDGVLVEVD